ncbi:sugar phosphate nucleotidyltransferase [Paenibacillus donghaensis]|nr:sugar phosphate nucleotidyltransferase [Paenibacillus donghaensis]
MQVVLLSGGSGKRLWPLSNEVRSKAFLKLLPREDGGLESMIERVCRELDKVGLLASSCIVTHQTQVEITRKMIGEPIPLLAEPHKKGTFTAVALAAAYLHSVHKADPCEIVAVLPVDSFTEPAFFQQLALFPALLAQSQAEIALLGAVPQHPSTQFGYIVPEEARGSAAFLKVARFAEKPDEAVAAELIACGAMWNCGVFACRLEFLLRCMEQRGLPEGYTELLERYPQLEERSFDREVLEVTGSKIVIPYNGHWEDIGSWDALAPHLAGSVMGEGKISEDSAGTYLVNELGCPVHVIGAPGLIVAAGPDGILVAGKAEAKRIKEQRSGLKAKPMIAERRWGHTRILDYSHTAEGAEQTTSRVTLLPGRHTSRHLHRGTVELWSVLSGRGEYQLGDAVHPLVAGTTVRVPVGLPHALRAVTQLELVVVEISDPAAAEGEDIVRLAHGWVDV